MAKGRPAVEHLKLPRDFEAKIERIQYHLGRGLSKADAAIMAGVRADELAAWLTEAAIETTHADPQVEAVRKQLRAAILDMSQAEIALQDKLANVLITAATKHGNVNAAQIVLERRFADSWGKETKVKHEGKVSHEHVHSGKVVLKPGDMSDDDLAILEGVLERQEGAASDRPKALTYDAEFADEVDDE